MNLVFMNSMEKEIEVGRFQTAAVSIVEDKGKHQIHWQEPDTQGGYREEIWFEGDNWEELMITFQFRVTEKMAEGYTPVIEKMPQRPDQLSVHAKNIQMLYFYSEQHCKDELYKVLRSWRRARSGEDGKAPYLIASNRLLRTISAFAPHTEEELLQIPGFGQSKWEAYGKEILELTQEFEQPNPFPLNWIQKEINKEGFLTWLYAQQELKFKSEAKQISQKNQLLQLMESGEGLEAMEKETKLNVRDIFVQLERLEQQGYDLSSWLSSSLEHVDVSEIQRVKDAYSKLGDRYLKPVLEEVYPHEDRKEEMESLYIKLRLIRLQYRHEQRKACEQVG